MHAAVKHPQGVHCLTASGPLPPQNPRLVRPHLFHAPTILPAKSWCVTLAPLSITQMPTCTTANHTSSAALAQKATRALLLGCRLTAYSSPAPRLLAACCGLPGLRSPHAVHMPLPGEGAVKTVVWEGCGCLRGLVVDSTRHAGQPSAGQLLGPLHTAGRSLMDPVGLSHIDSCTRSRGSRSAVGSTPVGAGARWDCTMYYRR